MACGVPVISSNTGGIPEVNIHGETGFLSNVGDTDDMAKNALEILTNDDLFIEMRNNAFERAKVCCIEKVLPMYEEIYESLVSTESN